MRELRDAEAELAKDNERFNTKKNGIRAVPGKDRTGAGNMGRPRGTKPNRNARQNTQTAGRRST